ncbi:MAG TPA: hypothetical protein VGE41_00495 [Verrucomicrobiae bacterium]
MKPKKRTLGVATAYGLLFIGVGIGLVLLGLGVTRLLRGQKDASSFLVTAGMFCAIPTIIFFALRAQQNKTRIITELQSQDPAPWLRREDWAKGEIVGVQDNATGRLLFGAGLGLLVAVVFGYSFFWNFASAAQPSLSWVLRTVFIIVFGAVPASFLFLGLRAKARRKLFGTSIFKMSAVPGTIGGSLEGEIYVPRGFPVVTGVKLKLLCLNIVVGSDNTNERTLWQEHQEVQAIVGEKSNGGARIPVAFSIPKDCEESIDADPANTIVWRLEARASLPGVNYFAKFNVPVFKPRLAVTACP